MWSRLRTKVLSKTPAAPHDPTDYSNVEFEPPGHVDDRKHVATGDVTMALVDKCSCGSPRLTTGSRHRGGDGVITSLSRKLDPLAPGSKSIKNEYTRTNTADNRKKMTSSTNAGHALKEEVNNVKNAALHHRRLPGNAVTSSHNKLQRDCDVDSDVDAEKWKSMNRKWGNEEEEDETRSCSNYTALNYDVNYVRVSPPKMTRRLKPPPEPETKMTREAQLAASRAAGTQPLESGHGSNCKTPPVMPRTTLAPRRGDPAVAKNAAGKPTPSPEVESQEPREAGSGSKEMRISAASCESDYIALSDLQATLAQSQQLSTKPNVDEPEVISKPEVDDSRQVTAKMFNDGENSFLQFTFTVKLDNGAAKKTAKSTTNDEDAQPPSVVSGTVDIVKSTTQPVAAETAPTGHKDATISMKPVVSVVQGGVVLGRDKPETRASSAGSKLTTNKPVGIAGIQLTGDDSRRHGRAETGSRPSSAGIQRSTRDQQQVCK